ncbi:regulatory protein MsaA [Salinicoccus jeotgali]|uniref:Regulatory protein MsaA n=1 Tax=Salinicoccus jeotgali TaxID=381634 RepID=A0ABP7EWE6_9STAP
MYEIVILKADYEGWWLFEGWQEEIVDRYTYDTEEEMVNGYTDIILGMKKRFNLYKIGKYDMHAFFNGCELEYCEDCDEDLQIFYTPIMTKDNEVVK